MCRWTLLLTLAPGFFASAQDETRQIFDTHFANSRVAVAPSAPRATPIYRPVERPARPKAGVAALKKPAHSKSSDAALGITIWKMLPSTVADVARLLVLDPTNGSKVLLTPHRIEAGDVFGIGDRVRLSIESPANGFLYVVDQELYSDGGLGPPYLIFPVSETRGGDNRVLAGQLVDIPEQNDPINAFTIKPKGPSDQGEKLTVLLSPGPIPGLPLVREARPLSHEVFRSWLQQFQSRSEHFELADGRGRSWTKAEQEAGADPKRLLTLIDPAPQTVFLFPGGRGKAILATVLLKFRR
jgi:hypothetical protein